MFRWFFVSRVDGFINALLTVVSTNRALHVNRVQIRGYIFWSDFFLSNHSFTSLISPCLLLFDSDFIGVFIQTLFITYITSHVSVRTVHGNFRSVGNFIYYRSIFIPTINWLIESEDRSRSKKAIERLRWRGKKHNTACNRELVCGVWYQQMDVFFRVKLKWSEIENCCIHLSMKSNTFNYLGSEFGGIVKLKLIAEKFCTVKMKVLSMKRQNKCSAWLKIAEQIIENQQIRVRIEAERKISTEVKSVQSYGVCSEMGRKKREQPQPLQNVFISKSMFST